MALNKPIETKVRMDPTQNFFWKEKTLTQMTASEWESLCDGCAKCCLHKLEDEDTGEILYTQVACRLLNLETCRCTRYAERSRWVADCLDLRANFTQFHWMPSTCAYRLLAEGGDLPDWHPLVSGDAMSTQDAGLTVKAFAIPEQPGLDPENYVIEWLV